MARISKSNVTSEVSEALSGIGRRIQRARLELATATDHSVTQADLGVFVSRRLGMSKPVTGATVSRWEAEESLPDVLTLAAIARATGVDPGWLTYGRASSAPSPDKATENPELDALRRATISILLSKERQEEVGKWQGKVGRNWNARFNKWEGAQRKAWKMKDPTQRAMRLAELQAEFEALTDSLNEAHHEAVTRYREAFDLRHDPLTDL